MRATFELLKADHDGAQGEGYWRTYLATALDHGELAVLPNHGHVITPAAVPTTIEFLERHRS
ncbi:MAG: hypothetical protein QOE80_1546 [Actinomycetota bacterium]|jgi:hypothetical protein|nr:hypothetical protein [Actinomycetota bacterium]